MSKPKLCKWYMRESPTWEHGWYAEREDGKDDEDIHGAHCKACAMIEVLLAHPDGDCDLRQFAHSPCYGILQVTVVANRRGEPQEEFTDAKRDQLDQERFEASMAEMATW